MHFSWTTFKEDVDQKTSTANVTYQRLTKYIAGKFSKKKPNHRSKVFSYYQRNLIVVFSFKTGSIDRPRQSSKGEK
jgi:hypothetical protein